MVLTQPLTRAPRRTRWIAAGYVVGFTEGACSHLYCLWAGGIHAYRGDPVVIQLLFHAMLVFDALVVALIARAHPIGPPAAATVMVIDGAANWWTLAGDVVRRPLHYLVPFGLLPITLFGVFVLATAVPLRRAMAEGREPAPHR